MRRMIIAAFALAAAVSPALAQSAQPLSVRKDHAARLLLGGPIKDVVVANPAIADVAVLDARSLVVMGKAEGSTSVLVVDPAGRVLAERQVIVSAPDDGQMTYVRGGKPAQNFVCTPQCGLKAGQDAQQSPTP